MDVKKIEEALFKDETFLKCLPILQEKYWDKAVPSKKLEFFNIMQKCISSVDSYFPEKVIRARDIFDDFPEQNILVGENKIVIKDSLFVKGINPYSLLSNYIFELAVERNYSMCDPEYQVKSEKRRRMIVNYCASMFGDWSNHFERESPKFHEQPITYEASLDLKKIMYDLVKFMHETYGMDKYIGEFVSNLMISSFSNEKIKEKVASNYKVMLERYKSINEDINKLTSLLDYYEYNQDNLSDEFIFSLFNYKIITNLDANMRVNLYKWLCHKLLNGSEVEETYVEGINILTSKDGYNILAIGSEYFVIEEGYEINKLMDYLAFAKIQNNLMWEIDDEKLKEEARECYKQVMVLKNEEGNVNLPYLSTAYPLSECKVAIINYYKKLIDECIKKNPLFNDGKSALSLLDDSKYEAFLQFAFNKSYDEVRKTQFEELQQAAKKIGGK